MRIPVAIFLAFAFSAACGPAKKTTLSDSKYPNNVGDITPDSLLDDPSFLVCSKSNIPQYYAVNGRFEGEKAAIERYFKENFRKNQAWKKEEGYITIRFVVNCKGQSGRFRVQEMSPEYLPKKFPATLIQQLLQLTKQMQGWIPATIKDTPCDFYQYLCFTIAQGDIVRITP